MKKLLMFMSILMIGSQIRPSQEIGSKATIATFGAVASYAAIQGRFHDATMVAMSGASFATIINACENPSYENSSIAFTTYLVSCLVAKYMK